MYRSQRRGGKGVSGATLRQDDIVSHFFAASAATCRRLTASRP
ncbi:hypothetical protein AB0B48_24010 [Micromonospora sp. NPDC049089]